MSGRRDRRRRVQRHAHRRPAAAPRRARHARPADRAQRRLRAGRRLRDAATTATCSTSPPRRMSACADEPDDLVGWAGVAPDAYLPRRVYGEYLRARLAAAAARSAARLERVDRRGAAAPPGARRARAGARRRPARRLRPRGARARRAARRRAPCELPDDPRVVADPWRPGALAPPRRCAARRRRTRPDRLRADRGRRRAHALRRGARRARDAGLAPRPAAVRAPARPARAARRRRSSPPARSACGRSSALLRAHVAQAERPATTGATRSTACARSSRGCGPRCRTRDRRALRGRREPRVGDPAPPARARGRGRARRRCAGPGGCASSAAPSPGSTRGSRCGSAGGAALRADAVVACAGAGTRRARRAAAAARPARRRATRAPIALGLGLRTTPDGALLDRRGRTDDRLWTLGALRRGELWEIDRRARAARPGRDRRGGVCASLAQPRTPRWRCPRERSASPTFTMIA